MIQLNHIHLSRKDDAIFTKYLSLACVSQKRPTYTVGRGSVNACDIEEFTISSRH